MPTGFSIAETPDGGYLSASQPSFNNVSHPLLIHAYVNRSSTLAILDTGSSVTLIQSTFLNTIPSYTFRSTKKSLSSANNSTIDIIGEVELNIRINGLSTRVLASVSSNLVSHLLLGVDWINRYVVSIHPCKRTLIVQNAFGRYSTIPLVTPPLTTDSSPVTFTPICGLSFSSFTPSSSSELVSPPSCYVCHQSFSANNQLFRHLRDTCYPPQMREHIDSLTKHIVSFSNRNKTQDILWRYGQLFDTRTSSKINITIENAIDTGTHRSVHTPPYRRSLRDHAAIAEQADILLKDNRIEPSTSPWCSPVVLVKKKDGTTRFCVDYRKLNAITVKDSFPLPRLDDIFDQISGSNYFTKLDFKNGYFQVPLAPHDRPKTAFSTRDNHYQFTVLPQGVKNGPSTFQRVVNQVLGSTRRKYCVAYIDDILIFSKTFTDHLAHLKEIFELLSAANFRLSITKCTIASDTVQYLGHTISQGVIRPNNENIRGLLCTATPSSPRETFRFLKAAEYYRKFIKNFSSIASPLYKYAPSSQPSTSSNTDFRLSIDDLSAFNHLKQILTHDLVLRLPNFDLPFKLQTDASQHGIGAVLLQTYPEGDRPVCFMSKKLTKCQQRWPPIELECYAIVTAIQQWSPYLHGNRFILETDHKPLETLMTKTQLNAKCERWRMLLQSYDFIVKHIPGSSNSMPDYLSRSPVDSATEDSDDVTSSTVSPICTMPLSLPSINLVTTRSRTRHLAQQKISESSPPSTNSSESAQFLSDTPTTTSTHDSPSHFTGDLGVLQHAQTADSTLKTIIDNINDARFSRTFSIMNGLLLFTGRKGKSVPCVPQGKIRHDIMQLYHDTAANGAHFGRDKTLRKIRDRYYWQSMNKDISAYVRSCVLCAQNNPIRRKPAGHLKPITPPDGVWQLLSMDFHGPITPSSCRGNRYIIALTDVFSKFVITRAVRDCTADTAARFLQEDVILRYGTPKCILTDNGTHFTSSLMESLLKSLGIIHLYCTPYHPQTNGQIERFNSTMDSKIAALSNQSRSDWDTQLPFVTFNYNTTVHSTTQIIPFELMYGRNPVLPCDPQNPLVSLPDIHNYSNDIRRYISSLGDTARSNTLLSQRASKTRYDAHRPNPIFNLNDLVLIRNIHRRYKFDIRFEGPYRIQQRLNPKTYLVQHVHSNHITRQVTVDCLVPLLTRSFT